MLTHTAKTSAAFHNILVDSRNEVKRQILQQSFRAIRSLQRLLPAAMMYKSVSASRTLLARAARQSSSVVRRSFVTTPVRQVDLVQDLYLRELRAYKPTPEKPGDADAHVQKFSAPKAPKSPEEGNIAADLKSYESQQVDVEGQSASGEPAAVEEDWLELPDPEAEEAPAH